MDRDFLKALLHKLQVGNTRSIHLNYIPGRSATKLDVSNLEDIYPHLPKNFIEKLLSEQNFEFRFGIDLERKVYESDEVFEERFSKLNQINRRLTSIYYENEDDFSEKGIKTFGFGYPIFVFKPRSDASKLICAPIFIWKLDISRARNEWIIYRKEDSGILLNEMLINYLERDLDSTGFISITEDHLEDNLLDSEEVESLTNGLLHNVNPQVNYFTTHSKIERLEAKDKIRDLLNERLNPFIINGGVFGLYRSQKEAIIADTKRIIRNFEQYKFDTIEVTPYQRNQFSFIETDPSQETVLKGVKDSSKIVINGPPGTGKSQSLTAIIVNALANKSKVLVVCEKRTALDVIKRNLELEELSDFCAVIEDVSRDRKNIVKSARVRTNTGNAIDLNTFNSLVEDATEDSKKINLGHTIIRKKLLNDNNWTSLSGRFIRLQKKSNLYQKMYTKFKNCGLNFESEDISTIYNKLIINIRRNETLFKIAKTYINTFSFLKDSIFENNFSERNKVELNDYIKNFVDITSNLRVNGLDIKMQYSKKLSLHYSSYYEELQTTINEIEELYNENIKRSKKLFTSLGKPSNLLLGFLNIFSRKFKIVKRDKERIFALYDDLKRQLSLNYFNFRVKELSINLEEILPILEDCKKRSYEWFKRTEERVVVETDELNSSNFNKLCDISRETVTNFESKTDKLFSEANNSPFFKFSFELQNNFNSRIKILETIEVSLNEILSNYVNIADYTEWRKDYLMNDRNICEIFDFFIEKEIDDWELDFETWFIYNLLLENEADHIIRNNNIHGSFESKKLNISKYQKEFIKDYWFNKQMNSRNRFQLTHGVGLPMLYNLARNNLYAKLNSLRKIINTDFELFTDLFPVILVNPNVCSSLFEMKEGIFDLVIFDEASQLRVEDTYCAKLRGKHKVVSGDANQMPPSDTFKISIKLDGDGSLEEEADDEEDADLNFNMIPLLARAESLLDFATSKAYKETYLDVHYRSKHPDLIEFSNAAFYGSRLKPVPPTENYKAIKYYQVNGLYDSENGINKEEALKVINLIDELTPENEDDEIKSIGIATFNILQRNYILDLIGKKSEESTTFASKIARLRQIRGEELFVKNLENIQGEQRDIIIISTTFGKKRDGSFTQKFGPINQQKGFRLLNVIVTRAKYNLFVCTSIPDEKVSQYPELISDLGNIGKGVFYAYLAYAKAIENNDLETKKSILNLLCQGLHDNLTENERLESPFISEIAEMLGEHIGSERVVTNYWLGGFRIDILIKSKVTGLPVAVIECDGNKEPSTNEAYAWDIFRQNFLELYGLKFIRIWSINWWNNYKQQMDKLIEFIDMAEDIEPTRKPESILESSSQNKIQN